MKLAFFKIAKEKTLETWVMITSRVNVRMPAKGVTVTSSSLIYTTLPSLNTPPTSQPLLSSFLHFHLHGCPLNNWHLEKFPPRDDAFLIMYHRFTSLSQRNRSWILSSSKLVCVYAQSGVVFCMVWCLGIKEDFVQFWDESELI